MMSREKGKYILRHVTVYRTCKHCTDGIHETFSTSPTYETAKSTVLYYTLLFNYLWKIHFIIILPVLRSPSLSLPSRFSDCNVHILVFDVTILVRGKVKVKVKVKVTL